MDALDLQVFPDQVILCVDQVFFQVGSIGQYLLLESLVATGKQISVIQVFKLDETLKTC